MLVKAPAFVRRVVGVVPVWREPPYRFRLATPVPLLNTCSVVVPASARSKFVIPAAVRRIVAAFVVNTPPEPVLSASTPLPAGWIVKFPLPVVEIVPLAPPKVKLVPVKVLVLIVLLNVAAPVTAKVPPRVVAPVPTVRVLVPVMPTLPPKLDAPAVTARPPLVIVAPVPTVRVVPITPALEILKFELACWVVVFWI